MKREIDNNKKNPRANWEEKFNNAKSLHQRNKKLLPDVFEDENFEEWTW